jgi:hypothetical protein
LILGNKKTSLTGGCRRTLLSARLENNYDRCAIKSFY